MAGRQKQIKQVWFTAEDEENFKAIAEFMKERGYDVDPDNTKAVEPYSHTKVIRWAMERLALQIEVSKD